jgi:hypothetical protein
MDLKRGILKKKGLIFYNDRLVCLNAKGIFAYYDPKSKTPKLETDLNLVNVSAKLGGSKKDQLELTLNQKCFVFKVINLFNLI